MIIGKCPYEDCDNMLMTAFSHLDIRCPKFVKVECDKCNRMHWLYVSRVNPDRYTLEEFDKKFEVDEETKSISERVIFPEEIEV